MMAFIFFMYLITGVQVLANKTYKFCGAQIVLQLIVTLIISLLVLKSYITFGALNLTF